MIKAILFDMDGVLIDARDWHYDALNEALKLFGFEISRDAHLTTFDGLPTRKKLKILSETRGLPTGLHDFLNKIKQQRTLAIAHNRCKPTFNHQQAMSKLKQEGYKIGVCSNSVRVSVETMMNLSNLTGYIDVIYSNEDVKLGKPAPDMYVKAMEALQVDPNETLVLEDNEHGIQAALASGANLLKISLPSDVTYQAIIHRINEIEN